MTEKQERRRHRLATGIFHQPKHLPDGWQWAIQSPDEEVYEKTLANTEREAWDLLTAGVEEMRKSDFQADGWEAVQVPVKNP